MLWRCCPFLVLGRSIYDPQASRPLAGPKFQPPNETRWRRRGLGTTLESPECGSPPAVQHPTWQVQWVCREKRQINPQIHLWRPGLWRHTQEDRFLQFPTSALPSAGQIWDYKTSFGLFPRLTAGGSTPLSVRSSCSCWWKNWSPDSTSEWLPVKSQPSCQPPVDILLECDVF